jgi:hypothetical protein
MFTSIRPLAFFGLVFALGACSDDDPDDVVTTRTSPSANFDAYETFRFMTESDLAPGTARDLPANVSANLSQVNSEMREELLEEGLREVGPGEEADLLAFSLATTEDQAALYWSCVDGYWYGYWTLAWEPCVWLEPVYTEYTVGSVVVGLADPAREEIVFGSLIQGVVDNSGNMEERISDDMEDAFDDYPD